MARYNETRSKIVSLCIVFAAIAASAASEPITVALARDGHASVRVAALTLRRYLYLLGYSPAPLASLGEDDELPDDAAAGMAIVVGSTRSALPAAAAPCLAAAVGASAPFVICRPTRSLALLIADGGGDGAIKGAAQLLGMLGASFGIDGAQLPPAHASPEAGRRALDAALPAASAPAFVAPQPAFSWRGLQPFHDFAEGPDLWSEDTYAAILENVALMGGNAIGMHTCTYAIASPSMGPRCTRHLTHLRPALSIATRFAAPQIPTPTRVARRAPTIT